MFMAVPQVPSADVYAITVNEVHLDPVFVCVIKDWKCAQTVYAVISSTFIYLLQRSISLNS